jgi:(4-O-methyl)-D-glucuronate---lignin esterase
MNLQFLRRFLPDRTNRPHMRLLLWVVIGIASGAATKLIADTAAGIQEGFRDPPRDARPLTWWHWMNGMATKEGITADLEAMQRVGLGGAQLFFVQQTLRTPEHKDIKGDVVFMTPPWRELVMHAIKECDRLGLELSVLTCEGWGEGGGSWISPAESMQRVVWSEAHLEGGRQVTVEVKRPIPEGDYYEDIALLAFPTPPGDDHPVAPKITASKATTDPPERHLAEHDPALITMPLPMPGRPQWVQLDYGAARSFSSIYLAINEMRDVVDPDRWENSSYLDAASNAALRNVKEPRYWELQASGDGQKFRTIGRISTHGTSSIPETRARYFRIWMPVPPPLQRSLPFSATEEPPMEVTDITLGGPRIDRPELRAGKFVDASIRTFSNATIPARNIIPSGNIINLTNQQKWDAPPGEWTILRIGHASTGANVGPGVVNGLEANKLSRAAVQHHLNDGMAGSLLKEAGPLAGTALKNFLCDSWERGYENWSPEMRDEFQQRQGYSIDPWLVAFTGRVVDSVDASERFLWDFRRTIANLMADNYYGTLQQFAHQHGMKVYAEAAGHGLPTITDQLLCKGRTDVPMGEFWAGRGDLDDTKEAASAAHMYGQNIAAAESFTATPQCSGWTRDPFALKPEGDLRFCIGINRLCFHRFAHQPWLDRAPGMTMGQYGTEFDRMNTWWEPGAAWIGYLSRCQYLLQRGHFAADLCYFYGEDAPAGFRFSQLAPKPPTGFDFDICNAELLKKMTCKAGRITLPSGMSYRVLVLPVSDRMTPEVLQAVKQLVHDGATVVGPRPVKSPSLKGYPDCDRVVQTIAAEMWGDCDGKKVTSHAYGKGRIVWGGSLVEAIGSPPDFLSDNANIRFIHRRDGDAEIYFVSNQRNENLATKCTFRVDGLRPELWHADTAQQEPILMYQRSNGRVTVPLELDPCGSVFVVFRPAKGTVEPIVSLSLDGKPISVESNKSEDSMILGCAATDRDTLALTVWQAGNYTVTTAAGKKITAATGPIPRPMEVTGPWQIQFPAKRGAPPSITLDRLTSWSVAKEDGVKYFSGTATYSKQLALSDNQLRSGTRLFLDLGEVKNLAEVRLNNRRLGILWKPPFRIELTGAARSGDNELEVKVTNLWPNRLIGDQHLPLAEQVTWTSYNPYRADSPLLPSGLMGPVSIRAARELEFAP